MIKALDKTGRGKVSRDEFMQMATSLNLMKTDK
jgi:hypothetical protein